MKISGHVFFFFECLVVNLKPQQFLRLTFATSSKNLIEFTINQLPGVFWLR